MKKLSAQLDNAFDLVEQGVYTLDVFQSRSAKLTKAMEELDERRAKVQTLITKLEASQTTQENLIPQTEELLASYDDMTNEERKVIFKHPRTPLIQHEYIKFRKLERIHLYERYGGIYESPL